MMTIRSRRLTLALGFLFGVNALMVASPSSAHANALIGVLERVFGIRLPGDPRQGVEIPIPGSYPIGPTPLVIGRADQAASIKVTIAPNRIVVRAPFTIAGAPLFRCDAEVIVSSEFVSVSCRAKFVVQTAEFTGSYNIRNHFWELTGRADLRVLGHTLSAARVIINKNGVSVTTKARFGPVTVDFAGKSKWDLSDYSLTGSARAEILGKGIGIDFEIDGRGLWAEFDLLGLRLSVGPINPKRIWDEIVDAVTDYLNPLELGKKLVEEAIELGEDAVDAAKKGYESVKKKAKEFYEKAKRATKWARDRWNDLKNAGETIAREFGRFADWAEKRLAEIADFLKDVGCAVGGGVTSLICGWFGCDDPCDDDDKDKAAAARAEVKHAKERWKAKKKANAQKAKAAKEAKDDEEEAEDKAREKERRAREAKSEIERERAELKEAKYTKLALNHLARYGFGEMLDCPARKGKIWEDAVNEAEAVAKVYTGKERPKGWNIGFGARKNCHQYWVAIPKKLRQQFEKAEELRIVRKVGVASLRDCAEKRLVARPAGSPPNARQLIAGPRLYGHEFYTAPDGYKDGWWNELSNVVPLDFDGATKLCDRALDRLPAAIIEAESYEANQPKVADADLDEMARTSFVDDMAKRGLKRLERKRAKDQLKLYQGAPKSVPPRR